MGFEILSRGGGGHVRLFLVFFSRCFEGVDVFRGFHFFL